MRFPPELKPVSIGTASIKHRLILYQIWRYAPLDSLASLGRCMQFSAHEVHHRGPVIQESFGAKLSTNWAFGHVGAFAAEVFGSAIRNDETHPENPLVIVGQLDQCAGLMLLPGPGFRHFDRTNSQFLALGLQQCTCAQNGPNGHTRPQLCGPHCPLAAEVGQWHLKSIQRFFTLPDPNHRG